MKRRWPMRVFRAGICSFLFAKTKRNNQMSSPPPSSPPPASIPSGRFSCASPGCSRSFLKRADLTQHSKDCGQVFICSTPSCGARFKNKVSLHRHATECGQAFTCPLPSCGKDYKTRAGLQQHIKLCGYSPCPCGYRLNVIGEYVKHQRKCEYFKLSDKEKQRLLNAAAAGQLSVVQEILKEQPHLVNYMDDLDYTTILHLACENGHVEMVRWIVLQPTLMVSLSNREGKTPLFMTCERGNLEILKLLIPVAANGINIGTIYFSPLSIACRNGHVEAVRFLLTQPGIDVNRGNNTNALSCACDSGNMEILEMIIATPGLDANCRLNKGGTALHHACQCNQIRALKRLLQVPGIDVNATTDLGFTPLLISCQQNRATITVELLRDPRVDANIADDRGRTPLWMTAHSDYNRPFLNILAYSAQPVDVTSCPEGQPFSPVYQAIINEYIGDPEAFKALHKTLHAMPAPRESKRDVDPGPRSTRNTRSMFTGATAGASSSSLGGADDDDDSQEKDDDDDYEERAPKRARRQGPVGSEVQPRERKVINRPIVYNGGRGIVRANKIKAAHLFTLEKSQAGKRLNSRATVTHIKEEPIDDDEADEMASKSWSVPLLDSIMKLESDSFTVDKPKAISLQGLLTPPPTSPPNPLLELLAAAAAASFTTNPQEQFFVV